MLFVWQANLEKPMSLGVSGTIFGEVIEDVMTQVRAGIDEVWRTEPIYTGEPIVLTIRIEGKRAR